MFNYRKTQPPKSTDNTNNISTIDNNHNNCTKFTYHAECAVSATPSNRFVLAAAHLRVSPAHLPHRSPGAQVNTCHWPRPPGHAHAYRPAGATARDWSAARRSGEIRPIAIRCAISWSCSGLICFCLCNFDSNFFWVNNDIIALYNAASWRRVWMREIRYVLSWK